MVREVGKMSRITLLIAMGAVLALGLIAFNQWYFS